VCKKLITNSQPFWEKISENHRGIFFDSHCIYYIINESDYSSEVTEGDKSVCPHYEGKIFVSTEACTKSPHFHRKSSNFSLGGPIPIARHLSNMEGTSIVTLHLLWPSPIPLAHSGYASDKSIHLFTVVYYLRQIWSIM